MVRTRAATPATGMPALAGLLLVVFVIAGLLVYEAWSTGRSRREIAQRGLQDYAAYATWSTARAGDAALGSSLAMLFRGLASNRIAPNTPLPALSSLVNAATEIEQCDCALAMPADYYFRIDLRDGSATTAPGSGSATAGPAPSGWAAAKVGSFSPVESAPRVPADAGRWLVNELSSARVPAGAGFRVAFVTTGDSSRVVAFAPQRDSAGNQIGMLGFVGSPKRYANTLFSYLWQQPKILPVAITRGMANDSLLTASVTTPEGREIYRSAGWEPNLLSDTASLAPFGGGMLVRVALRRDAMARLSGGLIPASRVPVWVGLLLLTGLLTAIILRNLRREHELTRLRADFTASVSHELRTPLAQILLFGETLTLGRARSDDERTRAAEIIVREARRLMQLVENALQFSRADRPVTGLSPERLLLAPVMREVIAGFEPLAASRSVRIVTDLADESAAVVDRFGFRQILINLLDNALKYGPRHQTVTVGLSIAQASAVFNPTLLAARQQTDRHMVRVWVDDQGAGVVGRDRENIWDPFVRGRGGEAAETGCGLGLAVVRELAARHHGRTWVETAPGGQGSRFVVELPAADAAIGRTPGGDPSEGREANAPSAVA